MAEAAPPGWDWPRAEDGEPVVRGEEEPLLQVARRHPEKAARFLNAVLLSGSLAGVLVSVPCAIFFLSERWRSCGACGRPLHLWLLAHCALHVLQAPLRVAMLWRLRLRGGHPEGLATQIRQVSSSRPWRASTALSTASYAWFVVGIVWVLHADLCRPCPQLYALVLFAMVVAVAKPIVTLAAFRYCFGNAEPWHMAPTQPPRGASEELIARLPLVTAEAACPSQSSCAVCLADFEARELLRQLPCGHMFHRQCVDRWLRYNKVCPLCVRDVALPTDRARRRSWTTAEERPQFGEGCAPPPATVRGPL